MAHLWPTIARLKGPLTIICRRCNSQVIWSRERAMVNLGSGAMPHQVRAKLRCSQCGARGRDGMITIDGQM